MSASKVYFTDFHVPVGTSQLEKLRRLVERTVGDQIDFEGKFVCIKMHFGEPGNLSFLRPNYAKVVADYVKSKGGVPFLSDCNTLYVGRRKNALEHMDAAYENGFSPFSTGCQIIIGDVLKGTDDVEVPVVGSEYVKAAKIGRAIMDADIFISLTHFKGHEMAGFGGAVKNIGMGCGSRAGKMEQHNTGKPVISAELCRGCHICAKHCGQSAISYNAEGKAVIDYTKCVGCGRCIGVCNFDAIENPSYDSVPMLNRKMAEYAKAVVDGRPCLHISLVRDISPNCDCHGENDVPILPDVGMFASFDPVALDQACADACMAQEPIPGAQLDRRMKAKDFHDHHDHFENCTEGAEWKTCLEHGEKIGLGTREYTIIKL